MSGNDPNKRRKDRVDETLEEHDDKISEHDVRITKNEARINDNASKVEAHDKRITRNEKFRYFVYGAGATISTLLSGVLATTLNLI